VRRANNREDRARGSAVTSCLGQLGGTAQVKLAGASGPLNQLHSGKASPRGDGTTSEVASQKNARRMKKTVGTFQKIETFRTFPQDRAAEPKDR